MFIDWGHSMRFGHGALRISNVKSLEGEVRRDRKVDERTLQNKVRSKKSLERKKSGICGGGKFKKEVK